MPYYLFLYQSFPIRVRDYHYFLARTPKKVDCDEQTDSLNCHRKAETGGALLNVKKISNSFSQVPPDCGSGGQIVEFKFEKVIKNLIKVSTSF